MRIYIFIVALLIPVSIYAQSISGKVSNEKKEPLIGANVFWIDASDGTFTGEKGTFELAFTKESNKKLVASYLGHKSDTIEITNQTVVGFILKKSESLEEVIIESERDGVLISNLNPIKTEQINQTELRKAACCDLAGCFATQTTVQPQTTNVVTNSKELRILGLSGVYNQVLIDGFPQIQGLSYTYGISSIPGTLVDNIYVSKGTNSVLQGYESISGQINVETKEPDETEQLLLNVYLNSFLESHVNANYAFKKGKWSNLVAFHMVQPARKIDRDNDQFLDLPRLSRYQFFDKWKYGNEENDGWSSSIGIRFLNEKRVGGQKSFDTKTDEGSTEVYGQSVTINQPEIWTKAGYRFNDKHCIAIFASAFHHIQNSFFGTVKYDARQTNFYGNVQYELNYSEHNLKTGISFRYLHLDEDISFTNNSLQRTYAGNYNRSEQIPGVFAENTMKLFNNKVTWIVGIRTDHHNQFGFQVTPRTLLKYDFSPKSTVRASVGKGWRTVNLFSENINLLVSSRDIIFEEELQPEVAINYGINFTQKFEADNLSGYLSTDYYRTEFQNQIFPDYDTEASKAVIKNFRGTSISNGFQTELFIKLWQRFELKTGYNFLDVYRKTDDAKQQLPFNSKHKLLATFSYGPLTDKFNVDINFHWYGKKRMPTTQSNPPEFQRPDFSEPYAVVNTQFTYNFKTLELYGGIENLFDFRQQQAIIGWQDPFGPYFDSSSAWGPTKGREFYIGFRYYIRES